MNWKSFNPDKRRKWYFLGGELVSIDTLRFRILKCQIPANITVYKAINKKHKGDIVNLLFEEPVYHVDHNAKNGGDGTLEKPFKNIKDIPKGGNIILADGVYGKTLKK